MNKAIVMSEADNVATLLSKAVKGTKVELIDKKGGALPPVEASETIPAGNKIALCDLKPGGHMIKYGAVCGVVSAPISRGEFVHVHNVKSERINIPDEIVEDILREMHYTRGRRYEPKRFDF